MPSLEGGFGALVQSELHAYIATERFDGSQQARLLVVIFRVCLQVIHVEEVADLSMRGVRGARARLEVIESLPDRCHF